MRQARLFALALIAALGLGACATEPPGWTYAPASPGTPAPQPTNGASTPEPTEPSSGADLRLVARNISYDVLELSVPAGRAFTIEFMNEDAGIPHNVEIRDQGGNSVFFGDLINGVNTVVYEVPALAAGTYSFVCTPHPIPAMTGTLTVQ